MSAPTWQEIVEEFVNDLLIDRGINPLDGWREIAHFAAENAQIEIVEVQPD